MKSFLEVRISTIGGIIFLLLIAGAVGFMIFYQLYQITQIRATSWERQIEEI